MKLKHGTRTDRSSPVTLSKPEWETQAQRRQIDEVKALLSGELSDEPYNRQLVDLTARGFAAAAIQQAFKELRSAP